MRNGLAHFSISWGYGHADVVSTGYIEYHHHRQLRNTTVQHECEQCITSPPLATPPA